MNKIIPNIKTVEAFSNYSLRLEFEDGVKGEVDLKKNKGNRVFEYWNDVNNFLKVYISDHGSIAWTNDIEIDSLNCYLKITNQTIEELIF